MEKKILHNLYYNLLGYRHFLLAYSGGVDSTVLLHQLIQLRKLCPYIHLRAIHIHHNISRNADSWLLHCQQQCKVWNIPLSIVKIQINVQEIKAHGLESACRKARYNACDQVIRDKEVLLTAHHLNDQCETFLLALKRGSGPSGLAAMRDLIKIREKQTIILRPMLLQSLTQIHTWAQVHQLSWINDESNDDLHLDRNFLRLKILPLLNKKWPYFCQNVARSAKLCSDQVNLVYELLTPLVTSLIRSDGSLRIDDLYKYSEVYRSEILRYWLAQKQIIPSYLQIKCIWKDVICSRRDATPCVIIGKYEIRRFRNAIYSIDLLPSLEDIIIPWSSPWRTLKLPSKLGSVQFDGEEGINVRSPSLKELNHITIRFKVRDRFYLLGREGSRHIKKIWQELNVPPWMRHRIPLIFYGNKLIAALELFITQDGAPQKSLSWFLKWNKKYSNQD
ncbi:MAG: tRNA lysidine(34) synthetase TilS [Candidatus Dasytiphilus stammeri]